MRPVYAIKLNAYNDLHSKHTCAFISKFKGFLLYKMNFYLAKAAFTIQKQFWKKLFRKRLSFVTQINANLSTKNTLFWIWGLENRIMQLLNWDIIDTAVVYSFSPTLCDHMDGASQASLFFTISRSLLKLMYSESVIPSNHLILSFPSPPALNLSQHQGLF